MDLQSATIRELKANLRDRDDQVHRLKTDALRDSRAREERHKQAMTDVRRDLHAQLDSKEDLLQKTYDRLRSKEESVRDLVEQLAKERGIARELRKEAKGPSDQQFAELEEIMKAGYKVLEERNHEVGAMKPQMQRLQVTVDARDSTIASLNERILRLTMAPPQGWMHEALDAQAQSTLTMVKGLQQDVAHRDETIYSYQDKITKQKTANAGLRDELNHMRQTVQDLRQAAEGSDKQDTNELEGLRQTVQGLEQGLEKSSKKDEATQSILDEQMAPIGRLLEGNA